MQNTEFNGTQEDEIDDIQDAMNNFDEDNELYNNQSTAENNNIKDENNVKDGISKEIQEIIDKAFDEKKFDLSSEENFSFNHCQNELKSTLDFTEQTLYSQGFEKLRSAFTRLDDDIVINQDLEKVAKDSVEKEKQIEDLKAQKAKEDKEQRKDENNNVEQDKGGLSLEKRIEILEKELKDLKIKESTLK